MFNPWVGNIPWRTERLPTPVYWCGQFHGLYSPWGRKESDTTEQLSLSLHFSLHFSRFIPDNLSHPNKLFSDSLLSFSHLLY